MTSVTTIALDLAKSVVQIHGVDAEGRVVLRRRLRRQVLLAFFERLAPCLVAMEACSQQAIGSSLVSGLSPATRPQGLTVTERALRPSTSMLQHLRQTAA